MTGVDPVRVFRSAFDNAPIGMAVLSPDGVIQRCNPAIGTLLGRAPESLVGDTFFSVTHDDDMADALLNCTRIQQEDVRILRHECRFLRSDASVVWVSVTTSRVPAAGDDPAHLVMHVEDVDDRKALEGELRHQALHDPLTGLANRALLLERVERASGHAFCLLYLDMDGFKSVNDRFGHGVGDAVLREVGGRLAALCTGADTVARIGGDEFVVLRPGGRPDPTLALAAEIERVVAQPFHLGDETVHLTASVGFARSEPGVHGPDAAAATLDRADRDMYAVKRNGVRAGHSG